MDLNRSVQPVMDVVLRFFQEDQWNYQKIENKPVVRSAFRGERGTWICYARVDEQHRRVIFHAQMGINVPAALRMAAAAYLTRANWAMPLGNFEMDLDSGDIRFKTSVETPGGELTTAMVRAMAYTSLHAMDHYAPGVLAVLYHQLSPEAALARVEAQAVEEGEKFA